jgi:hypothetical protein
MVTAQQQQQQPRIGRPAHDLIKLSLTTSQTNPVIPYRSVSR